MDLPTPLGRRLSSLYFHLQRVEANFRFDLARIREYSEQIALLKSEPREMAHAAEVFDDVFRTIRRIIVVRTGLTAFNQFYSQLSVVIPYVIVAPFYFAKKVSFGLFNQAADAFGNVNSQMNFFVDRYIGLADFSATVARLNSFDQTFARTAAASQRSPRVERRPSIGENCTSELTLPDGRKLARIGNLVLVPHQSALVLGPQTRRRQRLSVQIFRLRRDESHRSWRPGTRRAPFPGYICGARRLC